MHRKLLLFLIYLCNLFVLSLACADENKLPTPLSLNQALLFAEEHPRSQIDSPRNQNYPLFKTLYLNCHTVAYTESVTFDNGRDRLFSPLFSSKESVQLNILQRFFDVLLADMRSAFDNENMAGAFITLDRAKNRQELNDASELEIAEKDANYQIIRQHSYASENSQRLTRSLLAQAVNRPENLSSDLKPINKLPVIPKALPTLDQLYKTTLNNNAGLIKRLDKLSDEEQAILKMDLRQYLLERLLQIQQLNVAEQTLKAENDWRDLKLDQSRTLYDMEVKADLGDSMAQQTKAHFKTQQINYCKALTWIELNVLQGKPFLMGEKSSKNSEGKQE